MLKLRRNRCIDPNPTASKTVCFKTFVFFFFLVNDLSHLLFNCEILSSFFFFNPRVSLQVSHSSLLSKMYSSIQDPVQLFNIKLVVGFLVRLVLTFGGEALSSPYFLYSCHLHCHFLFSCSWPHT